MADLENKLIRLESTTNFIENVDNVSCKEEINGLHDESKHII